MKAAAAIAGLVLAPLLGGCGFDVMYADWKVDRLCKVDGGIKVFMKAAAPKELKRADGAIDLLKLQRAKSDQPFYLVIDSHSIEPKDPSIVRLEHRLFRKQDSLLLGTAVVYIRPQQHQGIPFLHRDGHSCPSEDVLSQLVDSVFAK